MRRASIARARTRDLQNVEVLADTFSKIRITKKFAFVMLIGVLEYANLFMPEETPAKTRLGGAFQFLKPNGSLILAIENQLGF